MAQQAPLPPHAPGRLRPAVAIGVTLFLLLVGTVLFDRAMAQPFSHDEHQFIAAGWWLAKAGLLPYLDFPYHHMPYQIPLNALAVQLSPYVLLSGRLVSWTAAWLASGILLSAVWREFRVRSRALAALAGGLAVLVFISQPIVAYTTGQAWNHDWANLLALGAVVLQVKMVDGRFKPSLGFVVGLLVGLATGVRLSYAVLCPLVIVSAAAIAATRRGRWTNAAVVLAGIAVAGIPAAILLALDPRAFAYGNVLYPELNSLYRDVLLTWADYGPLAKISFFGETVLAQPGNVLLLVGTLALVALGLAVRPRERTSVHALLLVFLAAVLLFVTGFAPTPAWYQYFFACVPFAILTCAMVASRVNRPGWKQTALGGAAVVGCLSILGGTWDMHIVRRLQSPATWVPVEVHRSGEWLAQEVCEGPVLTLAPVLAMEAGLRTYEVFATGPFTWRVAHIIPEANRQLVGWVAQDDLDAYLAASPPTAILTGLETENDGFEPGERGDLEQPLETYAARMDFHRTTIRVPFVASELNLWTSPRLSCGTGSWLPGAAASEAQ
jgi:hypothetical protein